MLQDVLGSLVAVLAFTAVLYAPGYVVAYAADLFGFRQMEFTERSMWAIACSFSVVPIISYLVGRSAGLSGLCWLFGGLALGTLVLLSQKSGKPGWSRRDKWVTALLVCGWIAFVLLMLVDWQSGKRLFFSVVMADQSYRIAFTDAVARTGVPPANPLYFGGSPAPMRYYYFWYVLCAAVVKLAHVSARQSFIASSIWAGFGLLATVKLYTSHFFRWERRQRWLALGLLAVMGAGIIPALGNPVLQSSLNGDIEWWSVDPIAAWPDSLLWVPHHVASVLCCLLAFLFLWRTLESVSRGSKRWAVVLAAAAFASAFGLSIYVAFGFALLMIAWVVRLAVLRDAERFALWRRVAAIIMLSAVMLAPFVYELIVTLPHAAAGNASTAPAPRMFSLSVRRMIDSGLLTGLPIFASWNQSHPVLLDQAIRLILLLPGLAMELGLYGAVLFAPVLMGRVWPPQRVLREARGPLLAAAAAALLLATRPATPGPHDAGIIWRAASHFPTVLGSSLVFWVLVPLSGAVLWFRIRVAPRRWLVITFALCFLLSTLVIRYPWQKYVDPFALLTVLLTVRPGELNRPSRLAGAALMALAFVGYTLSFVV